MKNVVAAGLLSLLVGNTVGWSALAHADVSEREDVQAYITELNREHGFARAELQALFAGIQIRDDIIEKISRPAERVWTWGRYKSHLVDQQRVDDGVVFWREHRATLERAASVYGVAPEVVLAILGIET